ncbi:MAG: histidine--tRNA ligase [Thermoplasmatales archaeon]
MVERLRGFRDFYPEEQEIRRRMFEAMRESCLEYGFKEISGPSVESVELYANKSGMEIMNQMFSFKDKGGRDITLIPEFTPTLARMVSAKKDLVKPLKWYSIGKFWRYEEPQSGRYREFHQLNADIVGSESYMADAEVTSLSANIMKKLGIFEKVSIKVNSRKLLDNIFRAREIKNKEDVYYILDRWNKLSEEEKRQYMVDKGIEPLEVESIANGGVLRDLDDPELRKIKEIMDYVKSSENASVEIDLKIVRGLSYYTGYVFEAWDREEKFRAILGGGRYDEIIGQLGGERTPSVGFAVGDAVLENIMKSSGRWKGEKRKIIFLATVDERGKIYAPKVSKKLRESGIQVDSNVSSRGISKQLDYASKMGYDYVAIIGENEERKGTIVLKNLATGKQEEMAIENAGEISGKL